MKNQIKIIYIFITFLVSSIEAIGKMTIENASIPICDSTHGLNLFSIRGYTTEEIYEDYLFNFFIEKVGEYHYSVNCSIPTNMNSTPPIPTDSIIEDSSESESTNPYDSDSDFTEIPSNQGRLLENNYPFDGTCQILNITKNLSSNDYQFIKENYITIDTNVKLNFIKCESESESPEKPYESKLIISFRQLNEFLYRNRIVSFLFYGMISENLPRGYQITMEVKLIKKGYAEENTSEAICLLKNAVIVNNNIPVQGDFSCTIKNVDGEINSFIFYSSKYIAGIPEDKILLNPESTKKYIAYGDIIDFSEEENKKKITPNFISDSIDSAECNEKGIFKIKGKLNSDLNDDLNFELPLAYPKEVTATCSIKHGKANTNKEITCETNGKINNDFIMIAQSIIINKNKEELLIINKIEDKKRSNCKNGKTDTLVTKIEIPISITFRQVNQFNPSKNKATFHLIGIANQFVPYGKKIKMLVYIIINGKKEQKEANCILNTYTPFNSLVQSYGQVDFYCETNTANKIHDLEIISSDEVLGLNELDDYQKSPNSTDKIIKETETESNLGKVINYSSNQILYDIPPSLNIFDIYINDYNNCEKKGKIRVEANFDKRIDKQFDFIIPLSYPSSSIKCTAPKIEANRKVLLDCKVQKDFTIRNDKIIIEPRIIKKKYQEVIYVKKYSKNINYLFCKDYNTIQKLNEKKSSYTFLQTNNFKPLGGGKFSFKVLIYPILSLINSIQLETIKITIIVKKKFSNLRNLEDVVKEEEAICDLEKNDTIGTYNCSSSNININNENEIESLEIESEDISGINEGNNNPIETDININNSIEFNFSKIDISDLPFFNETSLDTENETASLENCKNEGKFGINGKLSNITIAHEIENFQIHFSNPPDSSGICNFSSLNQSKIICENKEYFEEEAIKINDQVVAGRFFFTKTKDKDEVSFTCNIGSSSDTLELKVSPIDVEGNTTEQSSSVINSYFSKKISSSGGLSGGTIAAIVICSAIILIAVGILITLIKKGVLIPPKSAYPTSYGSTVPEISNSSVDII